MNAVSAQRCTICGNSDWHDRTPPECTHCGLRVACLPFDGGAVRDAITAKLASGQVLPGNVDAGWELDRAGWRNAAWALGFVLSQAGDALLAKRACVVPHDVTLGMIARASDAGQVADMIAAIGAQFRRICIVFDGGDQAALQALLPTARVAVHPLDGDFAAQRNRVQRMAADAAGSGWVLQLDDDELPDDRLLATLGWLVRAADAEGVRSLGLPRRNLVDDRLSALFPDIQYRLNRADISFVGKVHERPDVPFHQSSLALAGAIEHRLSGARVRQRSILYEGMSTGAGRPRDEVLLLTPFDDATR